MDTSGVLTTLTLPAGVTLDSTKVPRFTVFGRYVVVVNSPTRPLTVDADGIVRVLGLTPPGTAATTAVGNVGSLSGVFFVKYSYVVYNGAGQVIAESELSPASSSVTLTSDMLRLTNLALSSDTISAIRLYRTTTGGSTYFPWFDLESNSQTTTEDDLADVSLSLVAAPILGTPPRLTHIGEFRERLWGVSRTDNGAVRYTEAGQMWSWPSTNRFVVPREGADDRGVTGILARRDALALARQNVLVELKGESNASFRLVKLTSTDGQDVGVEADDSIATFRDTSFFLAKDGVYTWSSGGINCISDGKVRAWFTTDTYFNRSRLRYAAGRIDPLTNKYQLLLSSAGSSVLDRWVEYDIADQTWWGPHKTDDFTPTWMTTILDSSTLPQPVWASSAGFFYKEQATRTDGTETGIAFDVVGKSHDMQTPDIHKHFGQLSLLSKIQAAGTLSVIPYVGGLDASAGATISASMTLGRERLRRVGNGRFCKLTFQHSTVAQDVELFGYEVPFYEIGRR